MTEQNQQSQQPEAPVAQEQVKQHEALVVKQEVQPDLVVKQEQKSAYQKTDNPSINAALGIISRAGIDTKNPVVQQALNGDTASLVHVMRYLNVEDGEVAVQLLEQVHKARQDQLSQEQAKAVEVIYQSVGGKDQWDVMQEFAKATYSPEDLKELITDLDAGGRVAQLRVKELHKAFKAAGGKVPEKAPEATEEKPINPSAQPVGKGEKLTLQSYIKERNALYAKGIVSSSPEMKALQTKYAGIV